MTKKLTKIKRVSAEELELTQVTQTLLRDLKTLIDQARERVAQYVNSELVMLYWDIGQRTKQEVLNKERAEYGKQIIENLAKQLTLDYGRGFSRANLFHMMHFTEVFSKREIVYALSRQLGWTHFRQIIYLKDDLRREFYAEMCRIERWSTRALQKKIAGMFFERTGLSKKPEELAKQELAAMRKEDKLTPDLVFQDPYLLDFLGLIGTYSEKDLEAAILREMEQFLLELGNNFSFIARQKRITVDDEDFYIDLLFYHRGLRRLVVIELKLEKFIPGDKGQMELYLKWLNKYERKLGEEAPIGLILCAGKSTGRLREQIELLSLDASGIKVAEYMTELLPKRILAKRLHDAIQRARERLTEQIHPTQITFGSK